MVITVMVEEDVIEGVIHAILGTAMVVGHGTVIVGVPIARGITNVF